MLAIRDLRFAWPGGADCVHIDALALAAGQTLFLHGPSGCGKSTLLGQAWSDLSAGARDARRAEHVGVIFQQFNLLPYLTVLDNVLLPCRFSAARALRCAASPAASARALLERMGLASALWSRRADALSVGQQQRVAAARALIGRPELVIADEPTSALDAARRDDFMSLLLDECRAGGSTLVFVSHDERLALRFDARLSLPELNQAVPS